MSIKSLVNLAKNENETLEFDEILADFDVEDAKIKGVRFNGKVFNDCGRLELSGWIAFEVIVDCAKCLNKMVIATQIDVADVLTDDVENLDAVFIPNLKVDLAELAQDLISVDLPIAFHCEECL